MDIYSILSSKPHNPHYLNKYITFIEQCQQKNIGYEGYVERHHICPKANDMFPEYVCFKTYPWNCAILTARQHYIAHLFLWKVFPEIKSPSYTINMMCNFSTNRFTSKMYENIRKQFRLNVSEHFGKASKNKINVIIDGKIKKVSRIDFEQNNFDAQHKNTVMVKDNKGNVFRVPIDDPRYLSGELVGHTKGKSIAKDKEGNIVFVSKDDPRWSIGELVGNNSGTITINNGKRNRRISPDEEIPIGWKRGMLKKNIKGTRWINNGKKSKMIKPSEPIPEGWVLGRV